MSTSHDEMVAFWKGSGGENWAASAEVLDLDLVDVGWSAIGALDPRPDETILDVGCGAGPTTLRIAGKVGSAGSVVGVDVSPPVLGAARGAAAKAGTTNVEFVEADVQEEVPAGPFDGVFSRFGVMFFSEPERAFANLHGVTKPGGRMAFACWAGLAENPWFVVPMMAIAGVPGLQLPPPPAPDAPGPFSLADTDRVRRILEAGGWRNVETESWTSELVLADDAAIDFRVQFTMRQGPAAVALANADVPTLAEVATRVRSALEEHRTDGVVRLGRKAWIVTALF